MHVSVDPVVESWGGGCKRDFLTEKKVQMTCVGSYLSFKIVSQGERGRKETIEVVL